MESCFQDVSWTFLSAIGASLGAGGYCRFQDLSIVLLNMTFLFVSHNMKCYFQDVDVILQHGTAVSIAVFLFPRSHPGTCNAV